jgi:hypothetical protein
VTKLKPGASALNFALLLSGMLLRLTPERAPRTVLRYERPENLGFYACLVTTNVGSFNFVIEKLFSSLIIIYKMKQYFVVFFISMVDVCIVVIGRPS